MSKTRRILVVFATHATRAAEYPRAVRPILKTLAAARNWAFGEITVDGLPFPAASDIIKHHVGDGDLVVAAGGDGLANAVLDGVMKSGRDATLAVLPLGQMNDFARSLNGRRSQTEAILAQAPRQFYPLEVQLKFADGAHATVFVGQYMSFGATAVLSDWLNSATVRQKRQKDRRPLKSVLLGARNIGPLAREIAALPPINFRRDGSGWSLNSFGFFLGGAGNLFRLHGGGNLTFDAAEFFWHQTNFAGKTAGSARAFSGWLLAGLPGEISEAEDLVLDAPTTLRGQIGGDSIKFADVVGLSAARSLRALTVLARAQQRQ